MTQVRVTDLSDCWRQSGDCRGGVPGMSAAGWSGAGQKIAQSSTIV